ncbi:pirin family protein [Cellvibrio sp. PSBB023]|uniref:pirin family protein n=1 Tax=Cellvibrio sp. PSBB023 TaxID=1945512 RepID=UPI00098F9274|nr:pirin family protein [Cellvibrio sp. PSBB023]AQT59783.1 quercetin 2,3-dioxygenase [Cellvibrio sp. PSBB023]
MQRQLQQILQGRETSDGAGVRIKRSLGQHQHARFDPFLMLDEFGSNSANDYIAGFPSHPHRGFETVTYMLEGHMLHEDHMGNKGHLRNGDVQWMTAGRGIIHSEMPQQEHGMMRGFQLWLNLPAAEKMKPAHYRDIPAADIPQADLPGGGRIKVIANTAVINDKIVSGPIQGLTTEAIYWDVHLPQHAGFNHAIPSDHNTFVYVYEGDVAIGEDKRKLTQGNAGLLSKGDEINLVALSEDTRFLVISGKPIKEPIVQYGPFVMNTTDEIEQAILDYRAGTLAS